MLTQIAELRGVVEQVPADQLEPPVVELDLDTDREIIDFEIRRAPQERRRKTVDWHWRLVTAWRARA